MNILIIDGQGGKIGALLVKKIKEAHPEMELLCIGTNSIATSAMLKAGAEPVSYTHLHNLADSETVEEADVTGTIADIRTAVVEGTTRVYVRLEGMDFYYVISVASSENAILFNVGDKVNLKTSASTGELRSAYQISAAK